MPPPAATPSSPDALDRFNADTPTADDGDMLSPRVAGGREPEMEFDVAETE